MIPTQIIYRSNDDKNTQKLTKLFNFLQEFDTLKAVY